MRLLTTWFAVAAFAGGVCTSGAARAQEGRGFVEFRGSVYPGADGERHQAVERARPTFTVEVSESVAVTGAVEAALSQGRDTQTEVRRAIDDSDFAPFLDLAGCQWPEEANEKLGISRASDYVDVDRLYVDYYHEYGDVRVGRQSVNWGSAQFLNPSDPFPEFLLAEPWRPRKGVNAARVNVPFGSHDATALVASNDAFTALRAAGRVNLNWLETDTALVGSYREDGEDGFVGVDIRGELGVGYWVEGGVRIDGDPHEEVTAGIDYSFPWFERFAIVAQYHRNGAGATSPDEYSRAGRFAGVSPPTCRLDLPVDTFGTSAEPDPFASPTSARDYAMLGISAGLTLDASVSLFWLQNLNDGTAMIVPTLTWVLADWLEMGWSATIPVRTWADGGEFSPRDQDLKLSQSLPNGMTLEADFGGLVPVATITHWTRASF